MARMNWEKVHALRNGATYAYDELPPVGSYQDQARYFSKSKKTEVGHTAAKTSSGPCSEFAKRVHGVTLFVQHIETQAYRSRPAREREQIKASLRDAVRRMLQSRDAHLYLTNQFVRKAARVCGLLA